MAIPTMFHFSRLTEVSMQSPNETASTTGGECEEQPVIQIRALEEHQTEDVGKPRVGECHTSIFSCKEDSSIQSVRTNRSLSDASRTSSEEKTKATACSLRKHPRKRSKDLRKLWRTSREEDDGLKSLKDTGSRRRNAQRNNSFFQRSPFFSITEHSSRPQQISQDRPPDLSDFRNNFWDFHHESCLRLHRLDLNLPSAVESQSILSDRLETNSTFIYAESIKCKNSCSIFSEDGQDLMSAWNGRSQDLYISGEEKSGSDVSGCSTQATAGSEYSGRSNGHLETFIDIDGCIYKDCSLAEAEWGSASSDSSDGSFCSPDKDPESWFYTSNKQMKPLDLDSCVLDNPCVPPDLHPEEFVPGQLKSQEDFRPDAVEDLYRDVEDEMNLQSCFSEFGSHEDSRELEGIVIQTERSHFSDIFCEMVKVATQEKVTGKVNINEGFLFHPRQFLQTKSSRYREGLEYSVLRHIQNGSYGDVFSIRDKQTGFTCAAKKIPLCSFRWEEVETWSRLNDSHVLQLFGAVREGPNVMLFMDLKRGSLAQVLRMKGHISEGLALYYHSQMVQALEHLHMRRVVHLDVKADNVLLSEDGRQCFLCDFGLSEMLSDGGYSTKTFRGNVLRGTESHMPPEVARGDRPSAKADVWSSCCMLLHMLNGHQPWTRYFPHPLYLKIVSEPPPLGEIPSNCDPLTFDVIKAGLVKDPRERHSASELLQKTMKALGTVCGLSNPGETVSPAFEDWPNLYHISSPPATQRPPESSVIATAPGVLEDLCPPMIHWVSTWRERAAHEDDSDSPALDSEEESEWEEPGDMTESNQDKMTWMERFWGTEKRTVEKDATFKLSKESDIWGEDIPMIEKCNDEASAEERTDDATEDHLTEKRVVFGDCGENDRGRFLEETESFDGEFRSFVSYEESDEEVESDLESLRELGKDWTQEEWEPFLQIQTLYPPLDPQTQSDVTYTDSDDESVTLMKSEEKDVRSPDSHKQQAVTDLCDSEQDLSEEDSDEMSSGVFSSCSTTDTQSFNVNWSVSTNQTSSCYLEGLGVDIWVEDVSGESLKIRERPQVKIGHIAVGISEQMSMRVFSLATLDGRLVSPDTEVCESGMWLQCVPAPDGSPSWDWRVKDGKLELQESDRYSDICSTLPL